MPTSKGNESLVMSYLTLRKVIGFMGVGLPFVVSIGAILLFNTGIQRSISAYYYTGMRDVFVGILWAIGFFLLSYNGYAQVDNIAGNLGCVFAIGVAIFPMAPEVGPSEPARLIGIAHFAFAALFFLTLIYFSYFLFTRTDPNVTPTPRKLQRNNVYRGCAAVMGLCIILITIFFFLPLQTQISLDSLKPVYWLEATAIVAFGLSWLTKGEAILGDDDDQKEAKPTPASD